MSLEFCPFRFNLAEDQGCIKKDCLAYYEEVQVKRHIDRIVYIGHCAALGGKKVHTSQSNREDLQFGKEA